MRKLLAKTAVVTVVAVMIATMPSVHAAAHGRRWKHCRYGSQELGQVWTHHEVRETIRCAASHWSVNLSEAFYIAGRESGFGANATNSYSGACGIFQSLPSLWPGRNAWFRRVTRWRADPSCYNARSNVLWAVRYAHEYGWGPWAM